MLSSSLSLASFLRASTSLPLTSFTRLRHRGSDIPNYTAPYTLENFEKPPIWADPKYKRRFLGQIAPKRTTRNCYIFKRNIPTKKKKQCPVCDNNKNFNYKDVEFIKNFICPVTNELIHEALTGVCRYQQKRLALEIFKARMKGLLMFNIPDPGFEYAKSVHGPKY